MIAALLLCSLQVPLNSPPVIPFGPGLRFTYVTEVLGERDWESQLAFISGDSAEAILRDTWFRPGPEGGEPVKQAWQRPVSRAERRMARSFNDFAQQGDSDAHRGVTWFMVSVAALDQLKRVGQATITYQGSPGGPSMRGTLARLGAGSAPYPVLLDGHRVVVPAVRARGTLLGRSGSMDMELTILDDSTAPWLLEIRRASPGAPVGRRQAVRISTGRSLTELVRSLEVTCTVTTSDILFASGSAELDPASSPAIAAIAQSLAAHPEWQLQIVGHTDSIGTAPSNLDLSRRRAARVRSVLVAEYKVVAARLTTDGRGEAAPIDDNGTPAGRARNRRVDLARNCQ